MNKTSNYYYYTAPVRNRSTSHWYVVQVLLPEPESVKSDDRKANGMTSLTDFCAQPITNMSPEYYATMWYATFFGNSRVMKTPKILSYVGDMDPMKFQMEDNYNCNDKQLMTR